MMGKFGSPQIGVFAPDGNNYDNPNLNKCPNCGALFDGTICPICKTVCTDRRKQSAPPQASKPVPAKAKKPVVLIVLFVLSLLLNGFLFLFSYAELLVGVDQKKEYNALQDKLTNTEHNAEAIRQQLAEARREYEEFKKSADGFSQLDELQKAAEIARAEADKANAEAALAEAEANKLLAQESYNDAITAKNQKSTQGTLVYEDDYVCIRYFGVEKKASILYDCEAIFLVENKTNIEITIQCSSLAFDGIAFDGVLCSDEIPPQSLGKARVGFDETSTTSPSYISGKLSVIDFSNTLFKYSYNATFVNVNVQ